MMDRPPFNDTPFENRIVVTLCVLLGYLPPRATLPYTGPIPCPECGMGVLGGAPHSTSRVFAGEPCHLGALLDEARDRGIY